jgi:hypothetical protein
MAEFHFRSMEARQGKTDVANRFGDRDFLSAVCTCFFRKAAVSKLLAIFVRYIMAEFHFRSMEASHIESDVTFEFLVGGLVVHFAGIFHLSFTVQKLFKNFMLVQWLNIFFSIFGGKYDPQKFFANIQTPKRHFLEKICVD